MNDGKALGGTWKILNHVFPAKAENKPDYDRFFQKNPDKSKKRCITDKAQA
ncbi:unnamed protein product [marine sediment metagenome]|uniref:Uncharacterized protein n=1 Tax=marine sediment metagenome TaxID=412755 RepID=X1MVX5_9ZZZZ